MSWSGTRLHLDALKSSNCLGLGWWKRDFYSNSMCEGLKGVSLPAVVAEAFRPSEITHSVCTFDVINHKSMLPC